MDTLIDVDAAPVAWREAGPADGDAVLFLHGLGGSRVAWDPQLDALAAGGFRCAAWDMPGYGASVTPDGALTFTLLADAVVAWMDALDVAAAHVVGLSLGGMIAQHVALRSPARVCSLALLDTSPAFNFDGATTAESWIEQRLAPMQTGASPASMADTVLRAIMGPDVADAAVAKGVAAMSRISGDGLAAAVRCLVTHNVRSELHRITVPTLVIVGEHDRETPLPYATFIADAIPGARLEVVAGAGHITNLEQPAAVNRLLVGFLNDGGAR